VIFPVAADAAVHGAFIFKGNDGGVEALYSYTMGVVSSTFPLYRNVDWPGVTNWHETWNHNCFQLSAGRD